MSYFAESSGNTSGWQNQVAHGYHYGPSVSLFDHAGSTTFTNSHINASITQIQARSTGLHFLGEKSAMGALYNSLERQQLDAPKCHPKTRLAVIDRIIDWLIGDIDCNALLLWLYGAAGAGKSAIAHSLAEICDKYGWLLATFFFWKTAAERSDITRFVATIAYQIACAIPASRSHIEAAVDANPMIFHQSIDAQLAKLIIEPLRCLHSAGFDFKNSPFVIIADGLDECQGTDIQSGLVKSLAAAFHDFPLSIRILIASRPEIYLQSTFSTSFIQPHLSRIALSGEYSPQTDIYRFLEDSFYKIRHEHPLASYIPSSWPSANVLRELTQKSSGQFIFASTTIKYVGGDPQQLPHRRLEVIRKLRSPKGEKDMPYEELNSLYHHVLCNVEDIDTLKRILGIFVIVNPNPNINKIHTTDSVDEFFFWERGETMACLSQLASIVEWDKKGYISILHASLSDFLVDPSRSHRFYLCRESVFGDCAAFSLRHLRQPELNKYDLRRYLGVTMDYVLSGPCFTPLLLEELSRLSFQTLYNVCKIFELTENFWLLSEEIIKMLDKQNLEEEVSHLISDLQAVCIQMQSDSNERLILLIYEARYSQILQVEVSNPDSVFPFKVDIDGIEGYKHLFWIIKRSFTPHPLQKGLELTEQHHTMVAEYFMKALYPLLCRSADEFHMAEEWKRRHHFKNLSALLCVTHVLPLACKSEEIMRYIFRPEDCTQLWPPPLNFHAIFTLDGWNDHIIQPARDAVLDYYKRYAEPSDVEAYMRPPSPFLGLTYVL